MVMPAPNPGAQETERQFQRAFFHDLAAALSGASLQIELAYRRAARGEDSTSATEQARAALSRAIALFEGARELLVRSPARPEALDFDALVEEAASASGQAIEVRGRTGGRVRADRARLSAALTALLRNAGEASPGGGSAIARERHNGVLRVIVENPGRLPEPDPERLFSPRAARDDRSWGFGLPTARIYAAESGGTLTLAQSGEHVVAALEFPEDSA
jgi:signal transduction histidine kinase